MARTLERIAELCGVSRSTVSRVVNDDPDVADRFAVFDEDPVGLAFT